MHPIIPFLIIGGIVALIETSKPKDKSLGNPQKFSEDKVLEASIELLPDKEDNTNVAQPLKDGSGAPSCLPALQHKKDLSASSKSSKILSELAEAIKETAAQGDDNYITEEGARDYLFGKEGNEKYLLASRKCGCTTMDKDGKTKSKMSHASRKDALEFAEKMLKVYSGKEQEPYPCGDDNKFFHLRTKRKNN